MYDDDDCFFFIGILLSQRSERILRGQLCHSAARETVGGGGLFLSMEMHAGQRIRRVRVSCTIIIDRWHPGSKTSFE